MFASELFNARWHEERSCFLEALCCILLMIPCDVERFCLQMLLQNACKNHQKYVGKTDDNGLKMVPKPLQNRSWRGSGGHLGATLETRCFQDLMFADFGSILGPPLGPVWGHFGHHFFDVFLKWLFDGLGLHLGSQNTSKMRPKRVPKPKPEIHRFCFYLRRFGHIQGC